ncbi:hypothetical protein P4H66_22945 [Paenibacillus dokdonensis]|uniref:Uncharacterized protein n=1 Tax=Paenibacillus dokdonensis TaxID=2567944 RepID=A0ABU6GSE8_9BACL|nr:hypothetical protein [Paenibacillus dokdonensis]MEC0242674.1 hypothetical protein [Paenibacillus dokdonensis]
MKSHILNGWKSLKNQFYIVIILFLYQLIWGYFLYRLVHSAVVPLLMRYPDPPPNELSQLLYYIEGKMSLSTSGTVHTYIWILISMCALRMLATPFIHAGIFYGLHREREGEIGLYFFQGMKRHGKVVFLFHLAEWILIAAPAYWIVPKIYEILLNGMQLQTLVLQILPYAAAWLLYSYIIHQLNLFMQFGKIGGTGLLSPLWHCLRGAAPLIGVSIVLGITSLLLFSLCTGISLIWAGIIALILQQGYHLVSCIMRLWGISAKFDLWHHQAHKNIEK